MVSHFLLLSPSQKTRREHDRGFLGGQFFLLQQETNWHANSLQSARLLHFSFFLSFFCGKDGSEGININYSYLFLVLNIWSWQKLKQTYPLLLRVWAWKQRQCGEMPTENHITPLPRYCIPFVPNMCIHNCSFENQMYINERTWIRRGWVQWIIKIKLLIYGPLIENSNVHLFHKEHEG